MPQLSDSSDSRWRFLTSAENSLAEAKVAGPRPSFEEKY